MSGYQKARTSVDGDIDGYQQKRRPWWVRLLRGYGGFLLGVVTIPVGYSIKNYYYSSGAFAYLAERILLFSPIWISEALYDGMVFTTNCFAALALFYFIGGLIGNHSMRHGMILVGITLLPLSYFLYQALSAVYDRPQYFPFMLVGIVGAVLLPYLLGFSVRRLAWIFWASRRKTA